MKKMTLIFILLLIGTGIMMVPVQSGILLKNNEDNDLHFISWESDELTIGWRHSVELTPWEETYKINDDGTLSFLSTTYQSYGAGTPDTEGEVEFLPDGFIQITGIERTMPFYSLYYVPVSEYYLANESQKYPLSQLVPADTHVHIQYKRFNMYEWLWFKMITFFKEG